MAVYNTKLLLKSDGKRAIFHNITEDVKKAVVDSKITNGIVSVISPHTTCAVNFEEMDHDTDVYGDYFLSIDLEEALDKIIPVHTREGQYHYPGPKHYQFSDDYCGEGHRWECLNGDAHLRSSIIGNSKVFSLIDGKLEIGEYGYIFFIDFDQRNAHERTCIIQIIGE